MTEALVTISVVSHRQNNLVNQLIHDLDRHCPTALTLILTENVPDGEPLARSRLHRSELIANSHPKGFGANHNAAFRRCHSAYFCVMNPDLRLQNNPFPELAAILADRGVGSVGPLVRTPDGHVADSARRFPTMASLISKLFCASRGPDYPSHDGPVAVDWIGGMCMMFRSEAYAAVRGFDERYFLYYEDVDLCRRLHRLGFKIIYDPQQEVIHDARRSSRRNARLALHHARSMLRYLISTVGRAH